MGCSGNFEAHLGRGGTMVQLVDTTDLPRAGSIAVLLLASHGFFRVRGFIPALASIAACGNWKQSEESQGGPARVFVSCAHCNVSLDRNRCA